MRWLDGSKQTDIYCNISSVLFFWNNKNFTLCFSLSVFFFFFPFSFAPIFIILTKFWITHVWKLYPIYYPLGFIVSWLYNFSSFCERSLIIPVFESFLPFNSLIFVSFIYFLAFIFPIKSEYKKMNVLSNLQILK